MTERRSPFSAFLKSNSLAFAVQQQYRGRNRPKVQQAVGDTWVHSLGTQKHRDPRSNPAQHTWGGGQRTGMNKDIRTQGQAQGEQAFT